MNKTTKPLDKRVLRSRKNIEDAFIKLLEDNEFEDISVSSIIKEAGYSRTAFYSNYENKDDCFKAIIDRMANIIVDANILITRSTNSTSPRDSSVLLDEMDSYTQAQVHLFEAVYHNKSVFRILINHNYDEWTSYFKRKLVSLEMELFTLSNEYKSFGDNLDFEMYNYAATAELLGYIEYWFQHGLDYSPEYMAKHKHFKKASHPSWFVIKK